MRQPKFLFWCTHLRFLSTMVYRPLFAAVQADKHHAAPLLAGPDGLPVKWAAKFRAATTKASANAKPVLSEEVCGPLVAVLKRFPSLGGLEGSMARESAAGFVDQAE